VTVNSRASNDEVVESMDSNTVKVLDWIKKSGKTRFEEKEVRQIVKDQTKLGNSLIILEGFGVISPVQDVYGRRHRNVLDVDFEFPELQKVRPIDESAEIGKPIRPLFQKLLTRDKCKTLRQLALKNNMPSATVYKYADPNIEFKFLESIVLISEKLNVPLDELIMGLLETQSETREVETA